MKLNCNNCGEPNAPFVYVPPAVPSQIRLCGGCRDLRPDQQKKLIEKNNIISEDVS